jgi:hypothetical protein
MNKRQTAITVMKANAEAPMAEVVKLIAAAINDSESGARGFYRWLVRNNMAPGNIEGGRVPRVVKEKAPKAESAKTISAKVEKSADDIAAIKAKNIATMKAVSAKLKARKGEIETPLSLSAPESVSVAEAKELGLAI